MDESSARYFAVFGNPVLHSRSPQLYNSLFRHDGINAYYTRIIVNSAQAVCEIIRILGLAGANITTPFKESVVPFLDSLSPDAEKISAVNTVICRDGELTGYNTDADGITGSLREAGLEPSGMRCMVMGAGGAGKAAVTGLLHAGAEVLITNRTPGKARDFAEKAGCRFAPLEEAVKSLRSFDLLVLTLPPGIHPFGSEHIHDDLIIADANYRTSPEVAGIDMFPNRIIRGDRWLLHQAVEAYRLFTGKMADTSLMESGLKKNLDPDKLNIRAIKASGSRTVDVSGSDMLIDARNLDDQQIKMIIDEEKNKAFKG
jgi:shikimate dehydrogenase